MTVYIVIGEKQNVYQDEVGGDFVPHQDKEIVAVFSDRESATNFVTDNKLAKSSQNRYGDISYYRNGYYDLEIESWEVR